MEDEDTLGKLFVIIFLSLLFTPFFSSAVFLILFSGARPTSVLVLTIVLIFLTIFVYIRYVQIKMRTLQLSHNYEEESAYGLEIAEQ